MAPKSQTRWAGKEKPISQREAKGSAGRPPVSASSGSGGGGQVLPSQLPTQWKDSVRLAHRVTTGSIDDGHPFVAAYTLACRIDTVRALALGAGSDQAAGAIASRGRALHERYQRVLHQAWLAAGSGSGDVAGSPAAPPAGPSATPGGAAKAQLAPLKAMHTVTDVRNAFDQHAAQVLHQVAPKLTATVLKVIGQQQRADADGTDDGAASASSQSTAAASASQWQLDTDRLTGIARASALAFGGTIVQWWHSANMARIFKQSLNTAVSCTSSGPPIHAPLCAVLGWGCHTFTVTTVAPLAPLVPPTTEEATAKPGAIWAASLAITQQQRRSQFVAEASEALFTSNGAVLNTKMSPHTHLELGIDGRVYVVDILNSFVARLVGKAPPANVAARVKSLAEALDKNAGQMLAGAGVAPSALSSEPARTSIAASKASRETTPSQRFVHEAHAHGVALRHLGDVYTATASDAARTILVSEMTARTCRDLYWARLVVTAGAAAAQDEGPVAASSGAEDAKATFAEVVKSLAVSDGAFLKHVVFPLLPGKFNVQGKVAAAYVNLSMTLKRLAAKVGVQESFVATVIAEAKRSSKGGGTPPPTATSEFAVRVVRRGGRAGVHTASTKLPMPIQVALPGATSADDPGVVGILGPKAPPALLPGHADNAKLSPVTRFLNSTVRGPVQCGTVDVASVFGATSDAAKKLTDAHRRLALEAATAQQQPGSSPAPPAVKELAQALDLVSLAAFALRAAFVGRGCAHGLVAAAGDLLAECKTVMAKLPSGQAADDTPEPVARLRAAVYGALMHHVAPTLGSIFDRWLSSAAMTSAGSVPAQEPWCGSEQKIDIVTHAAANAAALAAVVHGGAKVSEALGAAQQLARVQCIVSSGSLPVAMPKAPPGTGVNDYIGALREAEAAAVAELSRRASAKKEDGQQAGAKSASIAPLLAALAAFRQAVASVKKGRRTALLDPATLQVIGASDAGACTIRTALLELRALSCPLQLYAQTPLRLRNHVALALAEGTCQRVAAYVLPKYTRLIAADNSATATVAAESTDSAKPPPAPRTALARAATGAAVASYCELALALLFGRRFDEAAQYVESGLSVAREYHGPTFGLLRLQARITRCQDTAPEVQIQREWRRFAEEKLAARKRDAAAAVLQRLGRACVERRELRGLAALCRIQRAGRAFVARRDDIYRDLIVKPLQRVARGFAIRRGLGDTHAKRAAGAAVAGRVARAFVKRRALGVWRRLTAEGSTLIQRVARGAQERSRVRRLHCTATFQRIGRAFLQGRDRLGMLRGVLLHSCTKLQRLSRGLTDRRRLGREYGRNREEDVVTSGRALQRIGRGYLFRRLLQSRIRVVHRAKATALLNRVFAAYSVRTMVTTAQGHLRYLATRRLQRVGAAYAFGRFPIAMQRRLKRANACIPVQAVLRVHLAAKRANELAADEIRRLEALELVQRVMRGATTRACVETVRRWSGASSPVSPQSRSRPATAATANDDALSARSTSGAEEDEEDDGRLFMAAHVVERVLGDSLARQMASQCVARVIIGGAGRHAVYSRMRIMGEAARLVQAVGRALVLRRALSAVPAARRLIVRCFAGYHLRLGLATDQRMACRLQRVGRAMARRRRLAAYGAEERARLARVRVRRDNVLRACDGIDALLERRKEVTRSIVDTAASHDEIASAHRRTAFVERKSPALTRMALLRRPLGPLPHVVDGTTSDGHKWSVTRYSLARDIRQRAADGEAAPLDPRGRKLPPLPELADRDDSVTPPTSSTPPPPPPPASGAPLTPPPRESRAASRSSAALARLDGAGMPDRRAGSSLAFRRRALGRILGTTVTHAAGDDETLTPTPQDVAEIDSRAARRRTVHPLHERGPGPALVPRGSSCPPGPVRARPPQLQPLTWIDRRPARLPVEATPEPGTPRLRAL